MTDPTEPTETPAPPLVVEAVRSGAVESEHLVDVAVVDRSGALVAWAGDPERPAAFRSSAKPLQAEVARASGWQPADDAALAIACASHSGEAAHLAAVERVLAHAGVGADALRCPAAHPLNPDAARAAPAPAPLQHNCSGKHAAMLAACAAAGWPLEGYRAPDHPLQVRIRARLEELLGPLGAPLVDGCGVPTFVAPLAAFARAFGAVAAPESRAMRAHPHLVGGTGRVDSELMAARPGLLAKGGAEALLCIATEERAIALKVRDGSSRAVAPAAMMVLDALGMLDPDVLEHHRNPAILGGGEPVGSLRARGALGAS